VCTGLTQVLNSLLSNAMNHTPHGGIVTMKLDHRTEGSSKKVRVVYVLWG
jgi:signal transduction histidine kinase